VTRDRRVAGGASGVAFEIVDAGTHVRLSSTAMNKAPGAVRRRPVGNGVRNDCLYGAHLCDAGTKTRTGTTTTNARSSALAAGRIVA
jgi:hypothetical protein